MLVHKGPSAVVVVGGNIHVLVMSRATYDWADEQYLLMGLDPAAAKFIGTCMHNTTVPVGPCSEIRKVYWIMYTMYRFMQMRAKFRTCFPVIAVHVGWPT